MNHIATGNGLTRGLSRCSLIATLAVLVGLLLAACIPERPEYGPPEPFPCPRFGVHFWQEFNVGVDSADDVIAKIMRLWGHDRAEIMLTELPDDRLQMNWPDSSAAGIKAGFSAQFRHDRLTRIQMFQWRLPEPALVQVIDCLGPPDYYHASYAAGIESTDVCIATWYVEKGIVISGCDFNFYPWEHLLTIIPPGFRMDGLNVLPAGLEEMARSFTYMERDGNLMLCVLKPWPGSIEAIEIEEDIYAPCEESDTG